MCVSVIKKKIKGGEEEKEVNFFIVLTILFNIRSTQIFLLEYIDVYYFHTWYKSGQGLFSILCLQGNIKSKVY